MVDIGFIVHSLNAPPFNMDLTLVDFDEKKPFERLQVMNIILGSLSTTQGSYKHIEDLRDEEPEATVIRMTSFLRILNFKPNFPDTFGADLLEGRPDVLNDCIMWLLAKFEPLKKRAYLAQYLVDVEIPNDKMGDPNVQYVYNQVKEAQVQFKQIHKQVELLRNAPVETGTFSGADLRAQIEAMQTEKDQLDRKIQAAERKVSSDPNFEDILDAVSELRKQEDEIMANQARLQDQEGMLEQAQQRHEAMTRMLDELNEVTSSGGPEGMIHHLEEEVSENRRLAEEYLPKEISRRADHVQVLQEVLSTGGLGEAEILHLRNEVRNLKLEIDDKMKAKNEPEKESGSDAEASLGRYRSQAKMVAKKRQTIETQIPECLEELAEMEREIEAKRAQGGVKVLKGEAFKAYIDQLRQKSAQVKRLRNELSEIRGEIGVLNFTEQTLRLLDGDIEDFVASRERQRGVEGFRDAENQLEEVSSRKGAVDDQKAETLEEISRLVQEINSSIQEKRGVLAPLVKELRNLRTQAQTIEASHAEAKTAYDAAMASHESEKASLESTLDSLEQESSRLETRFFTLTAQVKLVDTRIEMVKAEKNGEGPSRRQALEEQVKASESKVKELRGEQKLLKGTHEDTKAQLVHLTALSRLLDVKMKCSQHQGLDAPEETEIADMLGGGDGPDTLVL
eukprot:TRINITY_DN6826_c0_g1_i1.p1 TRINITY_DN6826_c0_g1~~TRINITY_DN6826_c0_g1_i1.p1  ORF type:complete len:679 (+),score=171.06 TRINITY_DN6826_c0_g1_i1:124-2160(+)